MKRDSCPEGMFEKRGRIDVLLEGKQERGISIHRTKINW
jgi:hypothetical protein